MSFSRCVECSHGKPKSMPAAMGLSISSSPSANPKTGLGESSSRTPIVSLPYVCNICVQRYTKCSAYQYFGERREEVKVEGVRRREAGRKGVDLEEEEEEEEVVVKKVKFQAVVWNMIKVKREKEEYPKASVEESEQDPEGNVSDEKTSFDLPLDMQESASTKLESEDLSVSSQTNAPGAACGTRLTFIKDSICPYHAEKTLPTSLYLSSSNTCRRVLAKEGLHPDVTFGPYIGSSIKAGSVQEQDMHGDRNVRNWMYLVRKTSDDALANLRICMIRGKVFYRTIRSIPRAGPTEVVGRVLTVSLSLRNAELLLKSNI